MMSINNNLQQQQQQQQQQQLQQQPQRSLTEIMHYPSYIRNISIIAHVDHGKTALTESLAHVHMDVGLEKEKGITIKSAAVSLNFSRFEEQIDNNDNNIDCKSASMVKQQYLINLIDSPGHVDFNSEVSSALRITDGSICVVDCIEGVCVQTETVLRQSLQERVKPVLFLNKIDRIWLEKHLSVIDTYNLFRSTIESINVICHTYSDNSSLGIINIDPSLGNVAFGSGYFGYGFTLNDFAELYSSKFSMSSSRLISKFWGNNYWNNKKQKWQSNKNGISKKNQINGFCRFVLKPLQTIHNAIMNNKSHKYLPIISSLGLNITKNDIDKCLLKSPKELLKLVMNAWLPTKKCVLDLCADHLPSPIVAQRYRIPNIYTGPLDTLEAQSMKLCNSSADAPLSMYISKMIPTKDDGRFIAFGRVFSGTLKRGQELMILDPNSNSNNNNDVDQKSNDNNKVKLIKKKVQGIVFMMGQKIEKVSICPAGNICGLIGIDTYLSKSGTLTDSLSIHPFKTMKFSVSAVVKVAVDVCNSKDLKKLVVGLKKLAQSNTLLQISQNKQGQKIIAGAGELHLETVLNELRTSYMKNSAIKVSQPIVSFCESISGICGSSTILPKNITKSNWKYPSIMFAKSVNKHNQLKGNCEPISSKLCNAIENDEFSLKLSSNISSMKLFGNDFIKKFSNWNKNDATKIWTFGCPPDGKCNILVDQTKGIQYFDQIRDSIIGGFIQSTSGGILCDEPIRGIRFNLIDGKVHSDPPHRNAGQIIPMSKRLFSSGQLSSEPILLEPIYSIDIDVPLDVISGVHNTLGKVRGYQHNFIDKSSVGISSAKIIAHVPIIETFKNKQLNKPGFMELLRQNTKGKAFAVMRFSHWNKVNGNVFKDGSLSNKYIMNIRKRKGMKLEMPLFSDYYDKPPQIN